jgi:aspartyl-tRNA(Asn)/glutamyl-tRNA(Gln) amidotransferase subunit A
MSLTWMGLGELRSMLNRGDLSSVELTRHLLSRVSKADQALHAFTEVYADQALALAKAADQARSSRMPLGPLAGLPVVLKDLLDIQGHVSTLGSKHFVNRQANQTSATVERLLQAGMIALGKLHMTEFAFGGWGTNPLMGIGSDTGGSVRIPSAFNGLTGLKVTYGRISLHATGLLSWSLDTIGPMARNVRDCALLLDALAGPDPRDPTTFAQPLEIFSRDPRSVKGMRLALPDAHQLPEFMAACVTQSWRNAAIAFESLGADVVPVRLPDGFFDLAAQTGRIIASEAHSLHRDYVDNPDVPLGPAVRQRIQAAASFKPGEYAQVLRTMHEQRRAFAQWFEAYDALLLPTVAIPALALAEVDEMSPLPGYLTRPINYLGLCALSLPAGFEGGLPLGLQIVGKSFDERTVLSLGQAFQSCTAFHLRHPDLSGVGL